MYKGGVEWNGGVKTQNGLLSRFAIGWCTELLLRLHVMPFANKVVNTRPGYQH